MKMTIGEPLRIVMVLGHPQRGYRRRGPWESLGPTRRATVPAIERPGQSGIALGWQWPARATPGEGLLERSEHDK